MSRKIQVLSQWYGRGGQYEGRGLKKDGEFQAPTGDNEIQILHSTSSSILVLYMNHKFSSVPVTLIWSLHIVVPKTVVTNQLHGLEHMKCG